ncbi:MAG: hypothetical protein HY903_05415 [Deltaproteobacteria bacterium]|nr:hypothetical protein [Deltaproteobacteria bacterium]
MVRRRHAKASSATRATAVDPLPTAAPIPAATPGRLELLLPLGLALLALALYARTLAYPLIYFDDAPYLLEDPRIRSLSLASLWEIFTSTCIANYHPLTTLTYAVDHALFGPWIPGFRISQLLFYTAGVVAVYALYRRLLEHAAAAFFGAALFAVHAVHVEPVVWLASRKDVLCLWLFVSAVCLYLEHTSRRRLGRWTYPLTVGVAAAAMLAKGYAVVLPAVFAAYDYCAGRRPDARAVLEKLPLVGIAVGVVVATVAAQNKDTALLGAADLHISAFERGVLLLQVLAAYVGKTLWPAALSLKYVVSEDRASPLAALIGGLLLCGAGFALFYARRRAPSVSFAIALFLLPLLTVMNVVWTLRTWITDRYLLLPTVGACLAAAAAGLALWRRWAAERRGRQWPLAAAGAVVLVALGVQTWSRQADWQSEIDIWSDTIRKEAGLEGRGRLTAAGIDLHKERHDVDSIVHLAYAYQRAHDTAQATALAGLLRDVDPSRKRGNEVFFARNALDAGRPEEALRILRPLAEQNIWSSSSAWAWMGEAYNRLHDVEQARAAFREADAAYRRSGRPDAGVLVELGTLDFSDGRFDAAERTYEEAVRYALPTNLRPRFYLALAKDRRGKTQEAFALTAAVLAAATSGIDVDPPLDLTAVHLELGVLAARLGKTAEAKHHLEEVARREPDLPRGRQAGDLLRSLR